MTYEIVDTSAVQEMLSVSERTARRMVQRVREACHKHRGQFVMRSEFCRFYGLS